MPWILAKKWAVVAKGDRGGPDFRDRLRQFRKLTKTKEASHNQDSLLKRLLMGIENASKKKEVVQK